ncbi:MAG: hypothetical protein IJ111_10235 [Eggerthellaceae bacterium]|nr:hypothetical protein [Eggerthellaceae bacterium]
MIQRILAGTATDTDIAQAQAYAFDERKKFMEQLLSALGDKCEDALRFNGVMEDVANALSKARPVFAADLPVDQALGFITKLIQDSIDELEEAGAAETEEYEKQEQVLEKLNGFIEACNETGNTKGEEAFETVHLEYRGELGKLEVIRSEAEAGIGNALDFLQRAYGEGNEAGAFAKGIDRHNAAARFIGTFGSPSFFAFKHVGAPGEINDDREAADDAEED